MRQRITIEIEADERVVDEVTMNIEASALGQIGAHELAGYGIHKEILPERNFGGLQIPSFLVDRPFAKRREAVVSDGR